MKPKSPRAVFEQRFSRDIRRAVTAFSWIALALIASVLAGACSNPSPEPTDPPEFGSETNFLRYCSNDECGAGLVCNCGVCTRRCDAADQCSELAAGATCVSLPVDSERETSSCSAESTCEVECTVNADCDAVGDEYTCQAGVCRTGEQSCDSSTLLAGDFIREVTIDGTVRSFDIHVPASYAGAAPVPLVLDFHAMGSPSDWERNNSGFLEQSDAAGFIVVWPQGLDNTWNVGPCCGTDPNVDDFTFVTTLVRELSTEACIDQRAIYATGFSFGGAMAYYSACKHAEMFAAVAVSSMDLFATSEIECNPSRPMSTIAFRGTDDMVIPYGGGLASPPGQPDIEHEFQGAVGTFETWAAINMCEGEPTAADADGCSSYDTCADETEVVLCTVEGGGSEPGDVARAWEVLQRHRLP